MNSTIKAAEYILSLMKVYNTNVDDDPMERNDEAKRLNYGLKNQIDGAIEMFNIMSEETAFARFDHEIGRYSGVEIGGTVYYVNA